MSTVCKKKANGFVTNTNIHLVKQVVAIGGLALVVAGCSHNVPTGASIASSSYQTRHPIVVDNGPTIIDIAVGNERTHMTAGMRSAVLGLGDQYRASGAKSIQILVPSGSSNELAAGHIARHAKSELVELGVPKNQISLRSYSAPSAESPAHVRLSFVSVKARVASECGVWPTDISNDFTNQNYENFGCATQSNLAAIIADPNDLISPRRNGPINAERTAIVVGDFEANAVPPANAASF